MLINIKKEETKERTSKIIEAHLKNRAAMITEDYKIEKEKIDKAFLFECQEFFKTCKMKQDTKREEVIYFINFNYLRWAIMEDAIELQLAAYGENYYLGNEICCRAWRPFCLNKWFQEDLEKFQKEAKKILGYTILDYDNAKNNYCNFYYMILGGYCKEMCDQILKLEGYQKIVKDISCRMVFGGYMDKGVTLYPISKIQG